VTAFPTFTDSLAALLEPVDELGVAPGPPTGTPPALGELVQLAGELRSMPPLEPDHSWRLAARSRLLARFQSNFASGELAAS